MEPGKIVNDATVLVDQTSIQSVGQDLVIPAAYKTIDCEGLTIYPGLIDAFYETEVDAPSDQTARHWNQNVTPEVEAASIAAANVGDLESLHKQGITVRIVAPSGGIIKGSSAAVLVSDGSSGQTLLSPRVWNHLTLTVPRKRTSARYPNSPMGATALVRQTLYDAQWYQRAWQAYRAERTLAKPETNVSLGRLSDAMADQWFVFDAANERMALRADNVAKEFSVKAILRGSGREYRDIAGIAKTGRPVLVPVDFPNRPEVESLSDARNVDLRDLMHWDLAKRNPALLTEAGVEICLTTDGLESPSDFLKQVRVAVQNGLGNVEALAAVTTTPAKLLSLEASLGKIQPGMLANMIVTDGDLFEDETKVMQTWVAGKQFIINQQQPKDGLVGQWDMQFRVKNQNAAYILEFTSEAEELSGRIRAVSDEEDKENNGESDDSDDKQEAKLSKIVRGDDRLTALVRLTDLDGSLPSGIWALTILTIQQGDEGLKVTASLSSPNQKSVVLKLTARKPSENEATEGSQDDPASWTEVDEGEGSDTNVASKEVQTPILYPLGSFGLPESIVETPTVLFKNATVWTCDEKGVLENADVLVRDGKIQAIGRSLKKPKVCHVFDATGKHITPGLIDCHSHMGTDGGVNESGQAVTAEVRIGDFVDNSDINIYRQLAGGLTTANILHGSANPIGGQNQVVKLRWGESMEGMRMKQAPAGIKFALGENVKRNTSRYPNTRMGVQQVFRDQFLAAREYQAAHRRWRAGERDRLPPRIDLQLEAISEIQLGQRWIHCHSYRQDEIVATLDVLEEFGVRIGTLQHILEGYKVADRMAKHGAMGSAFSDWWAYKFEVYDAIPYNGALMHQQGVVVSFNSDDRELARRLNTEATKAVKYGGVSKEEALKFVTLNPAKQLRIDEFVGSLVAGKHADLVVWSGPPLSTLSRCEQTWIDGRRYFDLAADSQLRQRDRDLHARLVQKVLDGDKDDSAVKNKSETVEEEDRWARHDIFCGAHGSSGHVHTRWGQR